MYLSPSSLANCLPNGRVRRTGPFAGKCIDYTSPETTHHRTRWKRKRRDETAFLNIGKNGHQYLGTTSRITGNAKEQLAFVRSRAAGLEQPKPKKNWRPTPASFRLLSESDLICQAHGASDAMFDILVSDYRLAGHTDKDRVRRFVAHHGGSDAYFERAWAKEPRTYNAQERAAAHGLTHEQFRRLELHMSGCNTPPQERKCLSRKRWNAKRRQPGARTAEYARRTETRRAETAEIKRQAEAEVQRRMSSTLDSSRPSDGVSNIKSLGATVVTVTKLESEDKTGWIRPRITESYKSIPKIVRIDLKPPETTPKERLDSIPFSERVELMQRYCGLGRAEAEVEARKWLLN